MNVVFADTHYFIALVNHADSAHQRAVEFSKSNAIRLITTGWVITELANSLKSPKNRPLFARIWASVRAEPQIRYIEPSQALLDQGIDLFNQRPDKSWSLVDCISFVVMQSESIADALTGDHHFEQAGFIALLK
jgi:predicted nucleic acid-binding protein